MLLFWGRSHLLEVCTWLANITIGVQVQYLVPNANANPNANPLPGPNRNPNSNPEPNPLSNPNP